MTDKTLHDNGQETGSSADLGTAEDSSKEHVEPSVAAQRAQAVKAEALNWWHDIVRAFVYLTRVYVPPDHLKDTNPIVTSMRAFPVIGAIVGFMGGLVFVAAMAIDLIPLIAATLSVAFMIGVCGAYHEVGFTASLAALSASSSIEQRIQALRTRSIDTYGVIALVLVMLFKVAALTQIGQSSGAAAALGLLVAAGAMSRAAVVGTAHWLAPIDQPAEHFRASDRQVIDALLVALILATLSLLWSFSSVVAGGIGAALAALWVGRVALRSLGGQSEEIQSAVQITSEAAFLLVTAAILS